MSTEMSEIPLQQRVQLWMMACFDPTISADKQERNHHFFEEALELVQACGATQSEAHQLADYVYGWQINDPFQEVSGIMITLAALCLANDLDMDQQAKLSWRASGRRSSRSERSRLQSRSIHRCRPRHPTSAQPAWAFHQSL
jgi:hypothetical protein